MDSTKNYIHKYIKLPSFPAKDTYLSKNDAISDVRDIINANIDKFREDEEVIINYHDGETIVGVSAFLYIDSDGKFDLSVPINEKETLKIVESDNEPTDKGSLWLTEDTTEETELEGSTQDQISTLYEEIKSLKTLVEKHEYAFNNAMTSGDIVENSKKFELENSATPIDPNTGEEEDDDDDEIEPDYDEFSEPNVRHLGIKSAKTYTILKKYQDYLCENELVWCIGSECLYIYARGKDDTLKLFKVGTNGSIDTGSTESGITYVYDESTGILEINSDDVLISDDGILSLDGTISDDSILSLNDSEKTVTVSLDDETDVLSIDGTGVSIDEDGYINISNVNMSSNIIEL